MAQLCSSLVNSLISVIIPVYNVEKYLDECVNSVRNQTYRNLEIILVDDGSPDRCGSMCDAYAAEDARIRVIHRENGGLSAARNSELEIARGDFVTFVDSDDWIAGDIYSKCMSLFEAEPQLDAVGFGAQLFDTTTGDLLGKHAVDVSGFYGREELLHWYIHFYTYICTHTVPFRVYRRCLIEGLRFREGFKHEDCSYSFEVLWRLRFYRVIPDIGYYYRVGRQGSITTTTNSAPLLRTDSLDNIENLVLYATDRSFAMHANTFLYHLAVDYCRSLYRDGFIQEHYDAYLPYLRRALSRPLLPNRWGGRAWIREWLIRLSPETAFRLMRHTRVLG